MSELGLPEAITESLAKWGNLGVSKNTWSSYRTAETMLKKCQKDTGVNMELPLTRERVLVYIDWLASTRGLKSATIKTYLSGLRQMHIVRGMEPPEFRAGLARLVLKGIQNADGIAARSNKWAGRLPMTKNAMLLFKQLICNSLHEEQDKRLFWAVATIAFAGAFRIHKILAQAESTFDPDFTLLGADLTVSGTDGHTTLHVRLKCPKESRAAAAVVVDIYQNDSQICPVRAFQKWAKYARHAPDRPAFRLTNGTPLTGARMNKVMKDLLGPYTDRKLGFFATHSFRIGIASMLGQAGFEDQDIMATGRWSSRVFERYMKLDRTKRQLVQHKVNQM